ncbi:ATP-binding protein [Candidatus Viridilinea mediisalina]|uniref:histidine kinase n=1 Tax=Candidatus Viridilinea mediisalina TaxID=2024553 RepID=A0A2A6RKE6_9CHLR|nr:ATP-binding protein [Candidatus Viridilinea mediisalina]PDW03492.1 cyanobacterial phytochrome A [Candidatus Viridilinea mediisalina]
MVDLTNCDREPIHIPGTIQPHGVLLALTEPDLSIIQVSANTTTLLGLSPQHLLGQPLGVLFTPEQIALIQEGLSSTQIEEQKFHNLTLALGGSGQPFDLIVHRMAGTLILELEASAQSDQALALRVYRMVKQTVIACQRTTSVREFAQTLVTAVRGLTGFDRVMVYQFQADGSGVVIAEEKSETVEAFLDLRYPASDIPRQARELYLRNWVRLIPDVNYQPVALLALDADHAREPLDLSFASLRSVSPIHIEYLKNMGVHASMSISLVRHNQLWGLIACHHEHGPVYLPYDIRAACEFLGHMVSLQIGDKEATEDTAYRLALQEVQSALVQHMSVANDVLDGLTRFQPNLSDFITAGGTAVCMDGRCVTLGTTPPQALILQLVDWLHQEMEDTIFATNALPSVYPPITPFMTIASGLLAVRLVRARPNYLLWFRPEVVQTVNWGGNPAKPVEVVAGSDLLSPRKSFEVWKQTVTNTSLPWHDCELAAARDLRRAIIDLVLYKVDELARLNEELTRSNVELDSFAYVASHDLKEPLRGLHNYAHFLIEDYGEQLDASGTEKLETLVRLTQRMENLIDSLLHYSRVGRAELTRVAVDLNAELADVLHLLEPRLREDGVAIRVTRTLPTIQADPARVREVFANLIANALKYNDKSQKLIEIGYDLIAAGDGSKTFAFYVSDNGIGIAEEHHDTIFRIFKRLHGRDAYGGGVGAGLTIVKKIIERHGGTIWLTSQLNQGTTFWFTFGASTL